MKNKAFDLSTYTFKKDEALLFDANVWLDLFPAPSGKPSYAAYKYSAALKKMIQSGAQLVLDALILSEYINRYCRIEHQAIAPGTKFKQFRNSPSFAAVGKTAAVHARNIMGLCQRHNHAFATANINQILVDFEGGNNDLNDGLLADACFQHGWKLVTNDADFTSGGIQILTANNRLLASCK